MKTSSMDTLQKKGYIFNEELSDQAECVFDYHPDGKEENFNNFIRLIIRDDKKIELEVTTPCGIFHSMKFGVQFDAEELKAISKMVNNLKKEQKRGFVDNMTTTVV